MLLLLSLMYKKFIFTHLTAADIYTDAPYLLLRQQLCDALVWAAPDNHDSR